MKQISLLLALVLMLASCQFGGKDGNGRLPKSNSGYTDEEKEEIMNQNNPMRQGATYFHSASMDYSVQY
ncbi:MAG: hypothetical protein IKS64_00685, partial [Muribaculaceae bacterium]|nr:hypothetical protein [Muribaculaceae bacterium]